MNLLAPGPGKDAARCGGQMAKPGARL